MRPSRLKLHLEKTHAQQKYKNVDFFKRMEESVKRQRLDATGGLRQQSRHLIEAFYVVILLQGRNKGGTIPRSPNHHGWGGVE